MRRLPRLILSLFFICFTVIGFFYLFQRQLLYLPQSGDINPANSGLPNVQLIQLQTQDGLSLNSWYAPARSQNMPTIIYFHGNAGHISHGAWLIQEYTKAGYGMFILGYRGFSNNKGQPTEAGLYIDARTAILYLNDHTAPMHCIVLFGESLGTGIAVQMATEFQVGAVILQSPYTSITDVGQTHYPFLPVSWLLEDRYESIKKIHNLQAPLFIFHGEQDKTVPVELGKQLYASAPEPKTLKIYPNIGHNGFPNASVAVMHFLKKHRICSKYIN